VCRWSATHHWKTFKESYKFALDLVPIKDRSEKLRMPKVSGVQTEIVSGLHFGSLGKKCHSDASVAERHRKYYMGEGGAFPQVQTMVSQVNPGLHVPYSNTENVFNVN